KEPVSQMVKAMDPLRPVSWSTGIQRCLNLRRPMNHLHALEQRSTVKGHGWRSLWLAFTLLITALSYQASAQDVVYIYGTVKDYYSNKKIDGVTVTVFKNGSKLTEVITNASGKYEVNLDYGADYKLVYSK